VNWACLTGDLLTSQLFGHVKGSFTGATDTRPGLIAAADGGTLFLDGIGDLSYNAQASFLRSTRNRFQSGHSDVPLMSLEV
jgi:transcriptional regulator with GAF, ATPase, and Fis domain